MNILLGMKRAAAWSGRVAAAMLGRSVAKRSLSDAQTSAALNAGFRTFNSLMSMGPERTVEMWLRTFGEHPWLRACVNRIGEDMAALIWRLYELELGLPAPDGRLPRKLILKHPLLDIWKRPNPMMTGWVFRYLLQVFLELAGEAPILIQRDLKTGLPMRLWPIPPHWVQDLPREGAPFFRVWLGGQTFEISPREMIWIYKPNPWSPYTRGLGAAKSVDDEVTGFEKMAKFNNAYFDNGAQPGGLLMVPGMDADQQAILREQWEATHQGVFNAFKMAFLGYEPSVGKVEYVETSKTHVDMSYVEGRNQYRDSIVQAGFGLSPEKLGILENSNRSTIEAAELQHQTNILLPRATFLMEVFDTYLVPLYPTQGEGLQFEPANVVQESWRFLAEHAVELYKCGLATKNEGRVANGLERDPNGDVYAEPLNTAIIVMGEPRTTEDPRKEKPAQQFTPEEIRRLVELANGARRVTTNGRNH